MTLYLKRHTEPFILGRRGLRSNGSQNRDRDKIFHYGGQHQENQLNFIHFYSLQRS